MPWQGAAGSFTNRLQTWLFQVVLTFCLLFWTFAFNQQPCLLIQVGIIFASYDARFFFKGVCKLQAHHLPVASEALDVSCFLVVSQENFWSCKPRSTCCNPNLLTETLAEIQQYQGVFGASSSGAGPFHGRWAATISRSRKFKQRPSEKPCSPGTDDAAPTPG